MSRLRLKSTMYFWSSCFYTWRCIFFPTREPWTPRSSNANSIQKKECNRSFVRRWVSERLTFAATTICGTIRSLLLVDSAWDLRVVSWQPSCRPLQKISRGLNDMPYYVSRPWLDPLNPSHLHLLERGTARGGGAKQSIYRVAINITIFIAAFKGLSLRTKDYIMVFCSAARCAALSIVMTISLSSTSSSLLP